MNAVNQRREIAFQTRRLSFTWVDYFMTYASSRKVQAHPNRGDPKKELIEITTCSIDRLVHDILWEKLRLAAGDKYCIRPAKSVLEPWTSLYWFTWSQMLPLHKTEIAQLWTNTNVLSPTQLTAFSISVLKNMPKKMFWTGKLYEKKNWVTGIPYLTFTWLIWWHIYNWNKRHLKSNLDLPLQLIQETEN